MSDLLYLGLDTGGTYTDAVLYSERDGVIAKAKSLTTRHDLADGIAGAADRVLSASATDGGRIGLVCLSTTLATNALVEGEGGRVALVMIGFGREDLEREGLGEAVGDGPVLFLPGGHDVHGRETLLDLTALDEALDTFSSEVSAFAVAGYFAVRNPSHEIRVRDFIRSRSDLPVTCSHELSSKLGGPRRALTTLLNARLIAMIDRLIQATQGFLAARAINAPLMIVRGDGALIAAAEARLRPIETILSGPAASLVGARHLTGLDRAVVSDIGGTTTDIAILEGGRPRLDGDGAVVGGFRTMVEAVAMRTYGLGGDSEVHVEQGGLDAKLRLGPRRCLPLSLLGALFGVRVTDALARQLRAGHPGRLDGRFAGRTGIPDGFAAALPARERALYERLTDRPQPLDGLLDSVPQRVTLDRLVSRGLAYVAAFTPSDAMHVLGRQDQWERESARLGAELMARRKDGSGRPLAASGVDFSQMTIDRLTLQSVHIVLEAALAEDSARDPAPLGTGEHGRIDPASSPTIRRALMRAPGVVRFSLGLDRPLVALGASAGTYYPAIAAMVGAESVVPDHADVANAVGAVVGQVRVQVDAFVTVPDEGRYAVGGIGDTVLFGSEAEALDHARVLAHAEALRRANLAGAETATVSVSEIILAPEADGQRKFVEARIRATAGGRPRLAIG